MNPLKKTFSALMISGLLVSGAAYAQDEAAAPAEPQAAAAPKTTA